MNRNFEDARYYLGRAAETAKQGVREEIEGLQDRVNDLTGRGGEEEPEPGRVEQLQNDLAELEQRLEGEARERVMDARQRLEAYRNRSD
ncbi:MAG: hypothetical protein ABEJ57_05225 [Halobacteriaceae archaeon]